VGWHWFEWVDQPAEGRFDGENNGLVSEQDVPYLELTSAMGASALAGWEELLIEE
jgi:agarase